MRYQSHTKTARPTVPTVEYTVEQVWGAVAYAYRVNDDYLRETVHDHETDIITKANKALVQEQMSLDFVNVTDEDRANGAAMLQWLQGRLMFKRLRNDPITQFESELIKLVEKTNFTSTDRYYPAIAASQAKAYYNDMREQAMRTDVNRDPMADVGTKVNTGITVLRSVFSVNFNVFFVTAKTTTNHMVFFSYKKSLAPDSQHNITGTVKAHRMDSTQLNRVKIV